MRRAGQPYPTTPTQASHTGELPRITHENTTFSRVLAGLLGRAVQGRWQRRRRSSSRTRCSTLLLNLAEMRSHMCVMPPRARLLPCSRPLPTSSAHAPQYSVTPTYHPADRCTCLLQPFGAGQVRISIRLMARTRAARHGLGGGAPGLQSDVSATYGLRADRTPVGPQIVFACPRRYAAGLLGLLPPRPGWRTTSRRLRGRQGRRRGHRRPLARVSTMCCVRAGEGAVARAMAARGRRGRAVWPCEVREGAPGLHAPGRRP